jgi:glucose-6-phosphate 1-dehydrogenase
MPLRLEDITFSAGESRRTPPEPFVLVVFGASGDLAHRKLIPSFFGLECEGLLPEHARVIGFARSDKSDEHFRAGLRQAARLRCGDKELDEASWQRFASRLHYHRGSYDRVEDFRSLRRRVEEMASQASAPANRLFYLATPPEAFVPIVRCLKEAHLAGGQGGASPWSRIVIEKPFGRDLASAAALNEEVRAAFAEEQIFRIDHYLGKETVQNLLVLRFANSIFEPIWHQKYVDHVQITVSETLGVEGRGGYYDRAGAIRDIVQSHMMHLLCLVAMEPPVSLDADAIRDEKVKVLRALRPMSPQCAAGGVVRGQYAAGEVEGRQVPAYRELPDVAGDSTTETYVAFKAFVDNWRWSGVPFFLRTGKRLAARRTEVSIHFKSVPRVLFSAPPMGPLAPNVLAIRVQPDEGISMEFQVKVPGAAMRIQPLKMDFGYAGAFGSAPPEAYQRLLLDAALGDATLFTRNDEVEAAWRFITPILEGCATQSPDCLATYPAGSWGPKEADDLIAAEGNRWHVTE